MIFFNKRSTFVPYIRGREITVVANYAALPDPTTVGDKFYWCENSQGTAWLPGSLGGTYYPRGLYYSNGTTWEYMETPIQATQAEVDAGVIDDKFVSPKTLYNSTQWDTVRIPLETNGVLNGNQNLLNLVEGTNMTITDDGLGNITFDATGGGGGGAGIPHTTASGTDTYTATVTGVTAYNDGDAYLVRFPNGNTTSATLNINSIGAVTLYRNNDGPLIGGDIWTGAEMLCIYNSTTGGFQCIGTSPNSLFSYVTNDDSVTITKGQVVYAFGGTGDRMTVKLANNTGDATSAKTVGVVASTSIGVNQKGVIIIQGLLDGLSILPTSTYSDGDSIYLGATAGAITKTKPYAPNHLVYVATVTTASNGSSGRMYVRIQNGYELDELHNVQAQSPALKDTLYYDTADSQWKTNSITGILGYTPEDVANKSTNTSLGTSNTLYPTQNAVKTYADTKQPLTPRIQSVTSAATVTPTVNDDMVIITAQAAALTLANPTGTWVEGQSLIIRIKDNGTSRTIAYGAGYRAIGVTRPTATVINKTIYLGIIYNATDSTWDIIGYNQQA